MITKTLVGTTHVVAQCRTCFWRDDDYRRAEQTARDHATKTGHTVMVERGQSWVYNPLPGDRGAT